MVGNVYYVGYDDGSNAVDGVDSDVDDEWCLKTRVPQGTRMCRKTLHV